MSARNILVAQPEAAPAEISIRIICRWGERNREEGKSGAGFLSNSRESRARHPDNYSVDGGNYDRSACLGRKSYGEICAEMHRRFSIRKNGLNRVVLKAIRSNGKDEIFFKSEKLAD